MDVPDAAAAVRCTGPVWSTGTGTALWSGSSLRCRPEEVRGRLWCLNRVPEDSCYSPVQPELTHRLQDVDLPGLSELLAADAAHNETTRPSDAGAEVGERALRCQV